LVLAFKDFSEKIPGECQLLLLGEGEERTTLEEKVADLGLGGKVFFLGHSYFVNSVLDTCDAFILPSRWEGMPNALMEAMASKLPSVVTPVGAVPEMIADGKSGFISKGFDAVSLSAAMIKLFHVGDSERTAMGVEANRYIEENCSESAVMYMWENVLSDAIK
jgi:glycosyltransferase involved in cell wall biosynthesis